MIMGMGGWQVTGWAAPVLRRQKVNRKRGVAMYPPGPPQRHTSSNEVPSKGSTPFSNTSPAPPLTQAFKFMDSTGGHFIFKSGQFCDLPCSPRPRVLKIANLWHFSEVVDMFVSVA